MKHIFTIIVTFFIIFVLLLFLYPKQAFCKSCVKAYYINVDTAIERNHRFISRIQNKIPFARVPGIIPNELVKYNINHSNVCTSNTEREFCCSLSHLKAIHQAFHDKIDVALILEDDIIFLKQNINWNEIISTAPNDWEILQLFTFNTDAYQSKQLWLKHTNHDYSTGAYLIKRSAMEKILTAFVPKYMSPWNEVNTISFLHMQNSNCAADHFIYSFLNTYVFTKILFNEEGFDSLIHSDHLQLHQSKINIINKLFIQENE